MSLFLSFIAPLVLLVCVSGLTEEQVVDVSIRLFPSILKWEGVTKRMWIPKYWTVEGGVKTENSLAIVAEIPFLHSIAILEVYTDFVYSRDGHPVPVTSQLLWQLQGGFERIVPPEGWTKFEQDWGLLSEDGKVEGGDDMQDEDLPSEDGKVERDNEMPEGNLPSEDVEVEEDGEMPRREKDGNNSSSIKAESSLVVVACILLLAWV